MNLENMTTVELQKALLAADKSNNRPEAMRLRQFMSIEAVAARHADIRTPKQQAADNQRRSDLEDLAAARAALERAKYAERNQNWPAYVARCEARVAAAERALA